MTDTPKTGQSLSNELQAATPKSPLIKCRDPVTNNVAEISLSTIMDAFLFLEINNITNAITQKEVDGEIVLNISEAD